jgi:arylsulfatase A-like enzyme
MPAVRAAASPSAPPWPALDVLLAAVGFGVLAGGIEAVAAVIRGRVMHVTLFVGPEMVWQLPLTDGVIFLTLAVPFLAVGAAWSRLRRPRVVLALFAGLAAFAALLLTEKIHIAAEAVLAAGLGLAVARVLAPRSDGVRRVLRYGVPAALALLAVVAVGQAKLSARAERRELASLPAAAAGRPNILLLVLDTVRAWSMGLYGYRRPTTPKLQEWAASGTLFQRALAPAPWTTLTHAVMFTGHYPTELSVSWRTPYDGEYPTLAQVLRDAGYATAGFAGNYLNVGRGTGLAPGFAHYEDYPLQPIPLLRSTTLLGRLFRSDQVKAMVGRRRTVPGLVGSDVNRRFLHWLDGHGERPWFAFLNYFDAHGPYLPPEPFETMYMGKPDPVVDRYWQNMQRAYGPPPAPLRDLAEELDAYDGAITYLDQQVDSLLNALGGRGALGNTIVVVTSDHGELFGEHGVIGHGNNLFLPVLHVPLLIIAPGRVPTKAQIPSLASLRDLPATLLQLAGVPNPGLPGHSMVALWSAGGATVSDTLFASVDYNWLIPKWPSSPVLRGPMRTVVLDSLQYIRNGDGLEELYHLGHDSWEIRNLIGAPEYQSDLLRYRAALDALLRTARGAAPNR